MFFTENFPICGRIATKDEAPRRSPEIQRKLARVIALLEELVSETRPAVDVMAAKKAQRRENARRLAEVQDAYYSRNPHKPRKRAAWEDRLAARDGAAQFLSAAEQA